MGEPVTRSGLYSCYHSGGSYSRDTFRKGIWYGVCFGGLTPGNVGVVETRNGLVLVDTGILFSAAEVHQKIRSWSNKPITHAVYTHRHVDHVSGIAVFDKENVTKNKKKVTVIAHENVSKGFDRYKFTQGYNAKINQRQFALPTPTFGTEFHYPDIVYKDFMNMNIDGVKFEFYHGKGETDDATWVFLPEQKVIFTGDFMIWAFPNCGNPQKVQRYPLEWALEFRKMASKAPEFLLPGHGLPIIGKQRCAEVLTESAAALEYLVENCVKLMNEGYSLNEIIHKISLPPHFSKKPFLQPVYDDPQFILQNIWRLYGGWYDQNPANLKPPENKKLATEITKLCGTNNLVSRAEILAEKGKLDLACSLIEFAFQSDPTNKEIAEVRAKIYRKRSLSEKSLMARNIYKAVARDFYGTDQEDNKIAQTIGKQLVETTKYVAKL